MVCGRDGLLTEGRRENMPYIRALAKVRGISYIFQTRTIHRITTTIHLRREVRSTELFLVP